jgi:integrase
LSTEQPKSESGSRKVILSQAVIDGIEEQRAYIAGLRCRSGVNWKELDLVFPNRKGKYLDPSGVRKELKAVLVEARLDVRRFHDLRHSAATLLFAAGIV